MRRRFIWICVVAMCAGAVSFGWLLGGLITGNDTAIPGPGTATEDSIWIRNWAEEGRMWFPDGLGGHREPLGEIDRLTARVDSLWAGCTWDTTAVPLRPSREPVLAFADALPETMKPWADTDTKWVADHDGNRWVQEGTGRQCTLIDTLHWRGFDRLIPPWQDEITVSDTTWFAEVDGQRDIVLHVDGARMINTGDPEPLYLHATLEGRLHWAKGEWVFKGTP